MIDTSQVSFQKENTFENDELLALYKANNWSSGAKPFELIQALKNSHSVISARFSGKLIGLGNTISDGFLVVYYPHLLVHPDFQNLGIGKEIIERLQKNYIGFHQQVLIADDKAIPFYEKMGFTRAENTTSMWKYDGNDH